MKHRLYDVAPLSDCLQDPSTAAWLVQTGVPLPDQTLAGRNPQPAEIRTVFDAIPGIRTVYTVSESVWQVTVISREDVFWTVLAVKDYSGNPELPHAFCFLDGWDEIIQMLTANLAKRCGPLVLMHDSGAPPQVVM